MALIFIGDYYIELKGNCKKVGIREAGFRATIYSMKKAWLGMTVFAGVILGFAVLPSYAHAECEVQANLDVNPVIARVPRSANAHIDRTGVLSWTSTGGCHDSVSVKVSMRDYIDTNNSLGHETFSREFKNLPLTGKIEVDFPEQTFKEQAELECWMEDDPRLQRLIVDHLTSQHWVQNNGDAEIHSKWGTYPWVDFPEANMYTKERGQQLKNYFYTKTCYEGSNRTYPDSTLLGELTSWWGDPFTSISGGEAYGGKLSRMGLSNANPKKLPDIFCGTSRTYADTLDDYNKTHLVDSHNVPVTPLPPGVYPPVGVVWDSDLRVPYPPVPWSPCLPSKTDSNDAAGYLKSVAAPGSTISYVFSGIKILPNIVGAFRLDHDNRVKSFITYEVVEGGGTHLIGRVNTCSLFEGEDSRICDQETGPPGPVLPNVIFRPFGPATNFAWGNLGDFPTLQKYPSPTDPMALIVKDMTIKIDPDYAADKKKNSNFTPVYSGNTENTASPLDKLRVDVRADSFRSPILFNSKVRLLIAGTNNEEIIGSWPLELVKDGQHVVVPDLDVPAEMEPWYRFKNKIISDYQTTGDAYIYLEGITNSTPHPTSMRILDPQKVVPFRVDPDNTDSLPNYRYTDNEGVHVLKQFEVIHITNEFPKLGTKWGLNHTQLTSNGAITLFALPPWLNNDKDAAEFIRQFSLRGIDYNQLLDGTSEKPSMPPELDAWFKTQGPTLDFETPTIDLKGDRRLIDAISEKKKIVFRISRGGYDSSTQMFDEDADVTVMEKNVSLTNCAQIYGNGQNKIVDMWGKSKNGFTPDNLKISSDFLRNGFIGIEPYKSLKDTLSYYIDLKLFDDSDIITTMSKGTTVSLVKNYFKLAQLGKRSSCSKGTLYSLIADFPPVGLAGQSDLSGHFIFDPKSGDNINVYNHESGHALGNLLDTSVTRSRIPTIFFSNCVTKSKLFSSFSYNNTFYANIGDMGEGCGADKTLLGSKLISSSRASLMSYDPHKSSNLDTIECGWVMSRFKKGSPNSHYAECANLLGQKDLLSVDDAKIVWKKVQEILNTKITP
jgi:hypothetical protein